MSSLLNNQVINDANEKKFSQEDAATNIVRASGEIVSDLIFSHEVYGEGFYTFNLKVKRLSDSFDILPITVSERLVDIYSFSKGKKAFISGQLRSYNNYVDKKNRLILTIFAREFSFYEDNESFTDINEIFLKGYICKTPVYRTTPFGREIADLLIAVNRTYNKSDYIPTIAWGRNARFGGLLKTSDCLKIWGRVQSRVYQKRLESGEYIEKTAYEVSVSKMERE